ncbi:MAG: RluA family pseudouridine synthase [Opitutales bacterium]
MTDPEAELPENDAVASAGFEFFDFVVPEAVEKARADKVVAGHYPDFSRMEIQTVFDAGDVTYEGKSVGRNHRVSTGDVLRLRLPAGKPTSLKPVDQPLEILFEDAHVVVVNKPAGLVTHPADSTGYLTLTNVVLHHTQGALAEAGGVMRPGVVHRLDKETSGAILFAKTNLAYHALVKAFAARRVEKTYVALVSRPPELESGVCLEPIARHPVTRIRMRVNPEGKPAHTEWQVQARFGPLGARVRCWIHTGRTHQIRVHLSHLGFPIYGDGVYGYRHDRRLGYAQPRVMLHAEHLALDHPVTGERIDVQAPLPVDFLEFEARLRETAAVIESSELE